ncbi:GIY-YIG nuclease family protein [Metabacillus litoralis]|uniref:GIY-YIG nuclease family protein n=1 Tax=Metabacillus TaxID=2675233 RepID=UPI001BA3E41D|nr:GIY-YIG nuclease family protein [Metabacillus litoralis]UHA61119.1 GIY-YIG nuclease family protein [Metabacillus litoralis]
MEYSSFYVYFYYNKDNELLYIGKTKDVRGRYDNRREHWKSGIDKIGVREYPDEAIMCLFEMFYICTMPSIYNKEYKQLGETKVQIPDNSELQIYSLSQFKKKYPQLKQLNRPKRHRRTVEGKLKTIEHDLRSEHYNVVKQLKQIDLFESNTLNIDLDKTVFKWRNIYFSFSDFLLKIISSPETFNLGTYQVFRNAINSPVCNFNIKIIIDYFKQGVYFRKN